MREFSRAWWWGNRVGGAIGRVCDFFLELYQDLRANVRWKRIDRWMRKEKLR